MMNIPQYLRLFPVGLGFLILFTFSSCADENYGVEFNDELVPYVEIFKMEAAARGIEFDNEAEKIEGYIQNIFDNGIGGVCRRHDEGRNRSIIIDKDYWEKSNELEREFVVFHELGHCFLLRDHLDDKDEQGNCESIMASGTGLCNINYTSVTREELIDELFGL